LILEKSGLPVYLDDETNLLYFGSGVIHNGYGRRVVRDMGNLLYADSVSDEEEAMYDFYRGITRPEDQELFGRYDFRYDITVIMPGAVGNECKKTSGHYHGFIPQKKSTYPEIYEVIKGKAVYVLQKVNDFETNTGDLTVEDFMFVEVNEGQSIVIPPLYGHCSINAGDGPMVFSNIAVVACPLFYGPVKANNGMSHYLLKKDGKLAAVKNPAYGKAPQAKFVTVRDNPDMGMVFNKPVYQSFIENPEKFNYLLNPEGHEDTMMSMLINK
jgi:glucose-6-phosphate isomerase